MTTKTLTKEEQEAAAKNINPEDVAAGAKIPPHIGGQPPEKQDIRDLLEKVRKEEKSKLYPQIDHLKKSIDQLQREKEALVTKISSAQEDEKRKGDAKLSETQRIQQQMSEISSQNAILNAKLETMQEESQQAIADAQLDAYRSRKLVEAGGELIPELVFGNSEAEIDAAIIASRQRYHEMKTSIRESLKQTTRNTPVPPVGGTPPSDAVAGRQGAEELTAEMLANMTPEQWAKERMSVRRQVDGQMKSFFKRA